MKYLSFGWFLRALISARTCDRCNGAGGCIVKDELETCRQCGGEGEL